MTEQQENQRFKYLFGLGVIVVIFVATLSVYVIMKDSTQSTGIMLLWSTTLSVVLGYFFGSSANKTKQPTSIDQVSDSTVNVKNEVTPENH